MEIGAMRPLFFAMAMSFLAFPAGAQTVRSGIEEWQEGDAAAAVSIWQPLAEKGDADAAFNLGQAYRLGKGVKLDLATARSWYERAALKGHIEAQTVLGLLLFQNGDKVGAVRWLKPAAEAGETRALLLYGASVYHGDGGLKADPVLGYAYISRAAAQGLESAKSTLASLDATMPLEQRKAGVAMAQAMAAGKSAKADPLSPRPSPKAKPAVGPAPVVAKSAAPTVAGKGNWRIQLGAFSQRKSAETLFASLSGRLSGRQAYYIPVGAITRLQAGPFESRAAASAACAGLKPQACFPVEVR